MKPLNHSKRALTHQNALLKALSKMPTKYPTTILLSKYGCLDVFTVIKKDNMVIVLKQLVDFGGISNYQQNDANALLLHYVMHTQHIEHPEGVLCEQLMAQALTPNNPQLSEALNDITVMIKEAGYKCLASAAVLDVTKDTWSHYLPDKSHEDLSLTYLYTWYRHAINHAHGFNDNNLRRDNNGLLSSEYHWNFNKEASQLCLI